AAWEDDLKRSGAAAVIPPAPVDKWLYRWHNRCTTCTTARIRSLRGERERYLRPGHPGWRERRLRSRVSRQRTGALGRIDRERQGRRHLPALRLHPDEGPASRGRAG